MTPPISETSSTHIRTGWGRLLVEAPPLGAVARRPSAHWYVVATVCIGAFMGQLDASIVTLALPTLQADFHAGMAAVEWVALSYLLVLVALVTVVGRIADMVGRKLLYVYGFGIFVIGSALCGVAPGLDTLVLARVLQAVGAAMLQANSVALIARAMPPDKLGRGIGVQGAAQALGLALGPLVGGALVTLSGWRLIFLVNVPTGLVGMTIGWFLLPQTVDRTGWKGFDWAGAGLLGAAAAGITGALSFARADGITVPFVLVLVVASLLAAAAFVAHEARVAEPMVDLRLFRNVRFSAGIVSGLLSYLVMFGVLFLVPFYLELRRHLDAAQAGLTLAALPVALAIAAPVAGRLAERVGARTVTTAGMAITAAGLVSLGLAHAGVALAAELAWIGAGLGAFTPANNAAIMESAPAAHSGVAGGLLNMTRGFGTSLGVAATALVYGVAGGTGSVSGSAVVPRAFLVSALFLAAVAFLATVVAGARSRSAPVPRLVAADGGYATVGPSLWAPVAHRRAGAVAPSRAFTSPLKAVVVLTLVLGGLGAAMVLIIR